MCNCGKKRAGAASSQWIHTSAAGKRTTYAKESDARMAAAREGGTVKPKA